MSRPHWGTMWSAHMGHIGADVGRIIGALEKRTRAKQVWLGTGAILLSADTCTLRRLCWMVI